MNLRLTMTLAGAISLAASGQETIPVQNAAPSGKPRQDVEIAAPRAARTNALTTNALSQIKDPKQPQRTVGGLVPEIRKSTNRWRMFSLRRPANPKEDEANVTREGLRTEASGAVKLISVDF